MGKVVRIVAVLALAVAVAYYAPTLSLAILGQAAAGTAAAAALTAGIAAALTVAGTLAMTQILPAPSAHAATRWSTVQSSWDRPLPEPIRETVDPVIAPWWRAKDFYPWQRFAIARTVGDCMHPSWADPFCIIDKIARIQPGDYVLFDAPGTPRLRNRFRLAISRGLGKRYDGIDPETGSARFSCDNPPTAFEIDYSQLHYLHRVCAPAPNYRAARHIVRDLMRAPKRT